MTVTQIQHLLAYLGYYTIPVDGITGPGTAAAVRAFQKDFGGLEVDGAPGDATQAALRRAVWAGMPEKEGAFWKDVRYFTREEFRCQCGGRYCGGFPAEPSETLVALAEKVREHFGVPMIVSSGLRCQKHNAAVGGVSNSRHLSGRAMDFTLRGRSAGEILAYVQTLPGVNYAYAIDGSYVHMDVE